MLRAEGGEKLFSPKAERVCRCAICLELICDYVDVIFLFGGALFPLLLCSQEMVPLVGNNETGEKSCSDDHLLVFLVLGSGNPFHPAAAGVCLFS